MAPVAFYPRLAHLNVFPSLNLLRVFRGFNSFENVSHAWRLLHRSSALGTRPVLHFKPTFKMAAIYVCNFTLHGDSYYLFIIVECDSLN